MYQMQFLATDDADFAVTLDLTDSDTDAAWDDAADMEFTVQITEEGTALLTATTADGTLTRPADNQIAWRFTRTQMQTLCAGKTYDMGCIWEDGDGNISQLWYGTLAVVNGGIA